MGKDMLQKNPMSVRHNEGPPLKTNSARNMYNITSDGRESTKDGTPQKIKHKDMLYTK